MLYIPIQSDSYLAGTLPETNLAEARGMPSNDIYRLVVNQENLINKLHTE